MANKHSANTEYGNFSRTSQNRVYTHVTIICGQNEDVIRANHNKAVAYHKTMVAKYTTAVAVATSTGFAGLLRDEKTWVPMQQAGFVNHICGHSVADIQKWLDGASAIVANADASLATQLAANADVITKKSGGQVGWSSRLDLAVKNAAKYRAMGYFTYVVDIATGKVVA